MIQSDVPTFDYQVPWKSRSMHFGDHHGTMRGLGDDYKDNVSLLEYPDLRRMDVRQTLRDPYAQIYVRTYNQNNTTPVVVLGDLSSSMAFGQRKSKLDFVQEAAASIACSAHLAGDPFAFIGFNSRVLEDYSSPLSHHVFQHLTTLSQLDQYAAVRETANGILEAPYFLGSNRSLVFLISDFHLPLPLIEQALIELSGHQVIPLVVWDPHEAEALPKFGFSTLIDPETGQQISLFFRQALRQQFIDAFVARKAALTQLFLKFDYPPIFFDADFSAKEISAYFDRYFSL